MFEIDLEELDEGTWFQWQESHFDPEKGEFVFDPPTSEAKVKMRGAGEFFQKRLADRKRVREIVLNPKTRQMEAVSYFKDLTPEQEQKEREDGYDYMIVDFENFKNKKTGEIIECNRKNKIALMKVPAFDRFVAKCLRVLSGIEEKEKEDEEKN